MASPMILSTRPPKAVDVGDQALEAAVDEVLHLLGIARLGQRGEARRGRANRTVTTRRSSPARQQACPQAAQNRAPAGAVAAAAGQVIGRSLRGVRDATTQVTFGPIDHGVAGRDGRLLSS